MDIPFTTSPVNVKWATLMPSVRAEIQNNPEGFIEDRGWEFLEENEQKGGNKGGDEEDEEDSEFGTEEEEVDQTSSFVSELILLIRYILRAIMTKMRISKMKMNPRLNQVNFILENELISLHS